jgi:hypothetical protein
VGPFQDRLSFAVRTCLAVSTHAREPIKQALSTAVSPCPPSRGNQSNRDLRRASYSNSYPRPRTAEVRGSSAARCRGGRSRVGGAARRSRSGCRATRQGAGPGTARARFKGSVTALPVAGEQFDDPGLGNAGAPGHLAMASAPQQRTLCGTDGNSAGDIGAAVDGARHYCADPIDALDADVEAILASGEYGLGSRPRLRRGAST